MTKAERCRSRALLMAAGCVALGLAISSRPAAAQGSRSVLPADLAVDEDPPSELRDVIGRFAADEAALRRYDRFDASEGGRERMRKLLEASRRDLDEVDFDRLSLDGRVDALLFKNMLVYELRMIDREAKRDAAARLLTPFAGTVEGLEEARLRLEPLDARKAAETLAAIAKQVDALRKQVEEGKTQELKAIKKTDAIRASRRVEGLRSTLRHWAEFYDGYDPLFSWWTKAPNKLADQALERYAKAVGSKLGGLREGDRDTIVGDPIGRDALLVELEHEMIPYTPEELIAIAEREFAWCEAEMKKASNAMGCGDDWKKALERLKNKHVEPGKQPELIRDLARESIAFLDARDLVTIPALCRQTWRMEMMSPEMQRVTPFFTGGEVISVSYPTDSMTQEEKLMTMRGNNIHFSRATVHHEVIPGHHLQLYMSARHKTHRRIFRTPFLVEGWALYWELLLWDLDFPRSPEDRVGMLFWRMHRCARIIFSLSFHLEKMTPEQAIDFLVERVGHERSNATGEVRRSFNGSYPPLYQCAYMLGGMQLYALRKELVESGKMTNKQFHDAVLRQGPIPIEMVRANLGGSAPTREFRAIWKFRGDVKPTSAAVAVPQRAAGEAEKPKAEFRDRVE